MLEELERFKKGNDDVNFHARGFLRSVDGLTGDTLSSDGVSIGPGLGSIRVLMSGQRDTLLATAFLEDCPDHRILNVALCLQQQEAPRRAVLVTKDTNLRMKAKPFGLTAQDYNTDKVKRFDKLYAGRRLIDALPQEQLAPIPTTAAMSQNPAPHEIKTNITRAGEGTKIIFTCDI